MPDIRILIADDHPPITELLPAAMKPFGIETVGTANVASKVAAKYESCLPDVVVLDVRFSDAESGLTVAAALRAKHPEVKILFYSQFDQDELIFEGYRTGARAFVSKSSGLEVLADAIQRVFAGELYIMKDKMERMAYMGVQGNESPRVTLDAKDLEIFKLLALGFTQPEIAEKLELNLKTISNAHGRIKTKLGLESRPEMTVLAMKWGIIDASSDVVGSPSR